MVSEICKDVQAAIDNDVVLSVDFAWVKYKILRKFYATKTGESKRSKKYIFIAIHSRVYSHVSHTQLNR